MVNIIKKCLRNREQKSNYVYNVKMRSILFLELINYKIIKLYKLAIKVFF